MGIQVQFTLTILKYKCDLIPSTNFFTISHTKLKKNHSTPIKFYENSFYGTGLLNWTRRFGGFKEIFLS